MEPLLQKLESQLARLPVPLSVALPGNRKVGPPDAAVRLEFQDWSGIATLAAFVVAGSVPLIPYAFAPAPLRICSEHETALAACAMSPATSFQSRLSSTAA